MSDICLLGEQQQAFDHHLLSVLFCYSCVNAFNVPHVQDVDD